MQSYELVPVGDLVLHGRNPRRGDVESIRESIRTNGFFGTVVAQVSSRQVLAGNHRLLAAREEGLAEVPVVWLDVDDAQAQRILLADNRTSDLGTYDTPLLAELLAEVSASVTGLTGTGYDDKAVHKLLAALEPEPEKPALDDVPEPSVAMARGGGRV